MKTILDISKRIIGVFCLSAFLFSCSDETLNEINQDNDHPKSVESKYIIAELITSTAFHNIGGDLNTYLSAYIEHEVGIDNQLYRAEIRSGEPSSSSTFNNVWEGLYTELRNARIVIDQCSEGGRDEGNLVTRGIAEILAAYNSALITDMFGDVPWSEAALVNADGSPKNMTPKIDTQEEIYKGIIAYLDAAITDLQGSDISSVGSFDFLYRGDKAKWQKLAYGLKARYTLHLLAKSSNKDAELDKILDYVSKSFASISDHAAFNIYDASNFNPLFDFQWSRDGLAASESFSEKLIARNDPRLRRVFVDADWVQIESPDGENYFMAPNGTPEQLRYYYNTSVFVYSQLASTMFLSYHELLFIKAEALARKGSAEAGTVLKNAVIAAIANTELSVAAAMEAPEPNRYGGLEETTDPIDSDEAADYFDKEVKPLFNANPLREIMIQKYLAFFGASGESTEAYNDVRRLKALGENFISLANQNQFPLRCGYGNSDTTTNPEVKAAFGDGKYVYTEAVWWAGGTR
ncbi:MAG: SusD/RagB family nutrient-binding outer membrane lipoprotein [Candidatus Symbiothrix sp.]|jgi:hypothetical protein|nr:SusD/RagB family nutrient-binding outer membrane lipoprotein [Candidatus Symbiothrix sp.]